MSSSRINSRKKGARGEKHALEVLQKWTGKKFGRVPSSGGLSWKNEISSGDVICINDEHYFPFTVEVKNYRDINFAHLFTTPNADILKFWTQAQRDAQRVNKVPLLMMRYDGLKKGFFFVVIPRNIYNQFIRPYMDEDDIRLVSENFQFAILTSDAFFSVPYKEIRKPIVKHQKAQK